MSKIYDALQQLEAQRKAHAANETSETANPLDLQERPTASVRPSVMTQPVLEQTSAVTRFGAELHRRMGEAGLDGVQGLFALADQLQRALATVSTAEIDHAEADLERVAEQVRTMQGNLRQLRAVKVDLEVLTRR